MAQPGNYNQAGLKPQTESRPSENPITNLFLFILTIITATLVYFNEWQSPGLTIHGMWIESIIYASALISILLTHELGHYLTARFHKIDATLPYFIPIPIAFGTLGALIKMKEKIATRKQLLDIGAAGPIAGFIVAFALGVVGIMRSQMIQLPAEGYQFGDSLLFKIIIFLVHGPKGEGMDLALNPLILASWIGFFVTSINLLPASQLDGGHIIYAMIGKKHRVVSRLVFLACICWGAWGDIFTGGVMLVPTAALITIYSAFLCALKKPKKMFGRILLLMIAAHIAMVIKLNFYPQTLMWLFWAGLIFVFFKLDHPPVIDDVMAKYDNRKNRIDLKRFIIGIISLLIFLLTFQPMPVKILM